MMRQCWSCLVVALMASAGAFPANAQFTQKFFEENFDSLLPNLGGSVNERLGPVVTTRLSTDTESTPIPNAFSKTGPDGWAVNNDLGVFGGAPTVGNTGVGGQGRDDVGVDEWEGWSFASKDFWTSVDGQQRGDFANASGTLAVVDGDEYYDLGDAGGPSDLGYFNSGLSTPSIPLSGQGATTFGIELSLDSSWRPEAFDDGHPDAAIDNQNNQAVEILAVFDTGETVVVDTWNSDSNSADFKDANVNERLELSVFPTGDAPSSVSFQFNYANAANDWWWAIDNVEVKDIDISTGLPAATVFAETFDSVALGDSVNERRAFDRTTQPNDSTDSESRPDSFTHTAPEGWSRDLADTPGQGDDNVGVFEWEGWSFATPEFWTFADQQGREDFANGTGVIAIADGDEWDDLGDPDSAGEMNTLIESPEFAFGPKADGSEYVLQFDSSWRDEDSQTAIITIDYGNGPEEIVRWESDPNSPFFKDDNTNETVQVILDPTGPTGVLAFQYIGTNDWWWAVDNISVGVVPEPSSALLIASAASLLAMGRRR